MMLSQFPEFCELNIGHKEIFQTLFNKMNPQIAEFSFGYLYSWRKPLSLGCALLDDAIILKGIYEGKPFCFEPIGSDDIARHAIQVLRNMKEKHGWAHILSAQKHTAELMQKKYDPVVEVIEKREYFDYVYNVEDLAALKGEKYQSKRNFVRRFYKKYDFIYKLIKKEDIPVCLKFQHEWCLKKNCSLSKSLSDENEAIIEMLNNFEALELCGCMILVDGNLVALTLGEKLNSDTYVMHVEKAFSEYSGAYQTMNQLSASTIKSQGFKYINREEDLGQLNLRKTKLSYYPCNLVKKYSILLNDY